jgi:hypothetical protein
MQSALFFTIPPPLNYSQTTHILRTLSYIILPILIFFPYFCEPCFILLMFFIYFFHFFFQVSEAAQVVRLPRFSSFTVASGATVRAAAWDGSSGGVLAFKVLEGGEGKGN